MSGSSLIVALNLGERRLALKLGNSELDLTAAAKISLLKGELLLAPPLPAPVRSVVVFKTPLFVPLPVQLPLALPLLFLLPVS